MRGMDGWRDILGEREGAMGVEDKGDGEGRGKGEMGKAGMTAINGGKY